MGVGHTYFGKYWCRSAKRFSWEINRITHGDDDDDDDDDDNNNNNNTKLGVFAHLLSCCVPDAFLVYLRYKKSFLIFSKLLPSVDVLKMIYFFLK